MSFRVWNSIAPRRRGAAGLACLCIALAARPALALDGTWSASATSGALWGTATANNALLVKNGTGKLILTNTGNSIGNKISITAGTLEVGNERVLGATPGSYTADQLQISSGGTFRTTATATISANRGITIGSGGGTVSVNGGGLTLASRVTGSGNTVTVTGANALTLTASAVGTNVNWDFASNNGLRTFFEGTNALGTGTVTVRNGVRLTSQSMTTGTITNAVTLNSGAGLTARSSGGAQTYATVIFPSSGSVVFNRDDETTSNITITSSGSLAGNLTVDTSQFGANAVGSVFLDGVFSGTGGLTKSGTGASGQVVLRGANTYTGTTAINAGTLVASSSTSLPGFGTSGRVVLNGGTLQIPVDGTAWTMAQADAIFTNATKTSGALAIDVAAGTQTQTGSGYTGGIGLTKLGSGTLALVAANAYTGTTSIDNGMLQLGNGGAVGSLSTSSVITGSAGGTLVFNRSDTISSGTDFNSAIAGGIGVTQVGSGTVILAGANTYTGKTSITNGTLEIRNNTSLGTAPGSFTADQIQLANGATLRTSSAVNLVSGNGMNRGITIGTGTASISVNGGNLTAGRLTGEGNTVTVVGANALTLSNTTGTATNVNWDFSPNNGVRTFFEGAHALGTGTVTVRNGVRLTSQAVSTGTLTNAITLASGAGLTARSSGSTATYSNVTLPSAGSIILNKDDQATAGLTILSGVALTGVLTVDTSAGGTNAVGDVMLSGAFSGAGGLLKAGTGTSGRLILAGGNTYAGDTTINTGTLALGTGGSIASSAAIIVASNAAFDVSAVSGYTLGAAQTLRGAGTVVGSMTANGTISPGLSGSIGTLSFTNDLIMGVGTIADYQFNGADTTVGGVVNDLTQVTGNLTLDGSLNVAEFVANSFQSATVGNSWRLFNYTGTLTNNGLTLGTMPVLSSGLEFNVDTSTANQVNLVVVAAVPEPATVVLALVGLVFAGARMTRRRSRLGS